MDGKNAIRKRRSANVLNFPKYFDFTKNADWGQKLLK